MNVQAGITCAQVAKPCVRTRSRLMNVTVVLGCIILRAMCAVAQVRYSTRLLMDQVQNNQSECFKQQYSLLYFCTSMRTWFKNRLFKNSSIEGTTEI